MFAFYLLPLVKLSEEKKAAHAHTSVPACVASLSSSSLSQYEQTGDKQNFCLIFRSIFYFVHICFFMVVSSPVFAPVFLAAVLHENALTAVRETVGGLDVFLGMVVGVWW